MTPINISDINKHGTDYDMFDSEVEAFIDSSAEAAEVLIDPGRSLAANREIYKKRVRHACWRLRIDCLSITVSVRNGNVYLIWKDRNTGKDNLPKRR